MLPNIQFCPTRPAGLVAGLFFVAHLSIGHIVLIGILLAIAYTNLENILPAAALTALTEIDIKTRSYLEKKLVTEYVLPIC